METRFIKINMPTYNHEQLKTFCDNSLDIDFLCLCDPEKGHWKKY